MKAWIIKWNGIGDHVQVDQEIVAVLSARTSPKKICEYLELLYKTQECSLSDQIEQARYNNPRQNPYPANFTNNWAGNIVCGHNPYLEAFLATDIVMNNNENAVLSYQRLTFDKRKK